MDSINLSTSSSASSAFSLAACIRPITLLSLLLLKKNGGALRVLVWGGCGDPVQRMAFRSRPLPLLLSSTSCVHAIHGSPDVCNDSHEHPEDCS